ncbi:MAG: TFIIB-type zinc ribbon-containing protein [Methanomicrobiales archaeon]|nr:TFIIB-type zinc ribbon-containing protein [Methanomicrobiales archaeon]
MHNKELFAMYYCPKCKSQEIFPEVGGYVGSIYICKDCGYRGSFVLEVDSSDGIKNVEREERVHTRPVRSHTKER